MWKNSTPIRLTRNRGKLPQLDIEHLQNKLQLMWWLISLNTGDNYDNSSTGWEHVPQNCDSGKYRMFYRKETNGILLNLIHFHRLSRGIQFKSLKINVDEGSIFLGLLMSCF